MSVALERGTVQSGHGHVHEAQRYRQRPSLAEVRDRAVAATLPDGQVLIARGDITSGHEVSSAELFNPATDTFTSSAPASRYRTVDAVAATLPSGQVLIAGGRKRIRQRPLSERGTVQPHHGHFHELTGPGQSLTEAREGAVAATLPERAGPDRGRLALRPGRTLERGTLQPGHGHFTKLTGTGQSLTEPRSGAVAAALPAGRS